MQIVADLAVVDLDKEPPVLVRAVLVIHQALRHRREITAVVATILADHL